MIARDTIPLINAVLLSYNRPQYLRQALASLLDQSYENLLITVVDNPSPASEEVARIVGQHSQVKLIRNQENQGYTGGMNRGIEAADGKYIFLTEDDVTLEPDCVSRLALFMERHPATGLCAPIIYNKTERTIRCAGGEVELGAVYRRKIYGAGEEDAGQFETPFEVSYVDGVTMMARADLLKRLRGFREDFFMYVESLELCMRVRNSGATLSVVPGARAYHFEPSVGPTPPEIEFHKIKNFLSLYLLHAPARVLPEFLCRYALLNTLRTMFSHRSAHRSTSLKALWWVLRKTPSLLRERVQQHSIRSSVGDDVRVEDYLERVAGEAALVKD
ncbi:MAG TPA: glycosyltransferase family 2 protein [Pyrinomonadaceae bacterium]|jgi:GT2 family glycosyltransferase|nr:glycosyltransferase family 2 protein [Pyrinomonadaceae bacterium]